MGNGFLSSRSARSWDSDRTGATCDYYIGEGSNGLEVIVTSRNDRPTKNWLERLYKDRRSGRATPVFVIVCYNDGTTVDICGPASEEPPVKRDLDPGQIERVCDAALDKPNRHAAQRFLSEILKQVDDDLVGIRNQGLLSTHELRVGVPDRDDWRDAQERAKGVLEMDGRELIENLGYEIDRLTDQSYVLKDTSDDRDTAVAVFLEEAESFERAQDRFTGQTPVSYALKEADKKRLEYVIASSNGRLRLYTTNTDAGFGSRGRTDTFIEANTDLLTDENAGYLWLLFSAQALRDDGTLPEIMERSKDYAAALGERLRERIYDDVIPDLAEAIAEARDLKEPTKDELDETYRMALILLYRLLFIAYAEDEEFLPRHHNPRYKRRSLKQKAHELHEIVEEGISFDDDSTTHWDDVMELSQAIHDGRAQWGLPEYDGTLLSSDPNVSEAGAESANIEVTDDQFGPVLVNLLIDETVDGYEGPVDFRNLGVREFGVIYEGLLESELSVADQPLTLEKNNGEERYVPVAEDGQQILINEEPVVDEGQVYLHGQSGERKATGTYYTGTRFVEHLLEYSLEPALDEHLERLGEMTDNEAAAHFFDIRVADISMGSGHFLVGAVDRIESRLSAYLSERTLPGVEEELDRLRETAKRAFENDEEMPEVERSQLLRRQVARRCIYGVDLNPLATELARLSIWVHTFVPGLPLTFLDYNLRTGDSLAGIGTLDEVSEILNVDQSSLSMFMGGSSLMKEIEDAVDQIGRLADADAAEVQEARETRAKIEHQLEETRVAFDILAASRIDEEINSDVVQSEENLTETSEYRRAQKLLEANDPLHFPAAFPEVFMGDASGFDVIVGNPPWEEETIEEKAFWARHIPSFQSKTEEEQEKLKNKLSEKRPDLVKEYNKEKEEKRKRSEILKNGPFHGNTAAGSAPDMYVAFAWRFWSLTNKTGSVGVVIPRGAFSGDTTTELRKQILENSRVQDLTFLVNNKQWIFDSLHPQYTVALSSFKKSKEFAETIPIRGPFYNINEYIDGMEKDPHYFKINDIMEWTPEAVIPLPPSRRATEAFEQMVTNHPKFSYEGGSWKAVPVTPLKLGKSQDEVMDDGTIVLHRADDPPEENYLPVLGGKSFDFWSVDISKATVWADPEIIFDYLQRKRENSYKYMGDRSPFSEMPEEWVKDQSTLPCFDYRLVFRDSARNSDTRTVYPAICPPNTILLDTAPYLVWPRGDELDKAYLTGIMGSIPFDWCARRFVENHVSFYLLRGLPVPRPDRENRLWMKVVELAGRLTCTDEQFSDWAEEIGVECGPPEEAERQRMIHELDAIVAHLYELERDHLEVIFETFHDNWDHEPRMEAVLEYYDQWATELNQQGADATHE